MINKIRTELEKIIDPSLKKSLKETITKNSFTTQKGKEV